MDIVSDTYIVEPQREWDFLLSTGQVKSVTLKQGDPDPIMDDHTMEFQTLSPKETIVICWVHVMGYSHRTRDVPRPFTGRPTEVPTRTAKTSPPQAPTSPSGPAD